MEGQRGCLWVHVYEGKNLSMWSAARGYQAAGSHQSPYDTFVELRLASESAESHNTERVQNTKIVTNERNPRCGPCCACCGTARTAFTGMRVTLLQLQERWNCMISRC